MRITRRSPVTGKENTMDLPITEDQLILWKRDRMLIQDAFPNLSADQREFILTGCTPEDWDALFPLKEDE